MAEGRGMVMVVGGKAAKCRFQDVLSTSGMMGLWWAGIVDVVALRSSSNRAPRASWTGGP